MPSNKATGNRRDTGDTKSTRCDIATIRTLHSLTSSANGNSADLREDLKIMFIPSLSSVRSAGRKLVIALHSSGAGAGQWRQLGELLAPDCELVAPEHYGCDSVGAWTGQHVFTLADEAARTIALIDRADQNVHLVGHSYGGGVALRVAVERPDRIASLALYEPSAFHLLKAMGTSGASAFAELKAIVDATARGVVNGDYRGAATSFVDYWNGKGAWDALRPEVQSRLTRWAPKAPLDFMALIEEPTPARTYTDLGFPVLIMRGEYAPAPTRVIAEGLPAYLPDARLAVIAGAGHMGPLTHTPEVNAAIARHIAETEAKFQQGRLPAAGPRLERFGARCGGEAVS